MGRLGQLVLLCAFLGVVAAQAPSVPLNLAAMCTAGSAGETDIVVTWDEPAETGGGITEYRVGRSRWTGSYIVTTVGNVHTVTLESELCDTLWEVRVRAGNTEGLGVWSETVPAGCDCPCLLEGCNVCTSSGGACLECAPGYFNQDYSCVTECFDGAEILDRGGFPHCYALHCLADGGCCMGGYTQFGTPPDLACRCHLLEEYYGTGAEEAFCPTCPHPMCEKCGCAVTNCSSLSASACKLASDECEYCPVDRTCTGKFKPFDNGGCADCGTLNEPECLASDCQWCNTTCMALCDGFVPCDGLDAGPCSAREDCYYCTTTGTDVCSTVPCPGCEENDEIVCGVSSGCEWCTSSGPANCVAAGRCQPCSTSSEAVCSSSPGCQWCNTSTPSACFNLGTCPACRDKSLSGCTADGCEWCRTGESDECTPHGDCLACSDVGMGESTCRSSSACTFCETRTPFACVDSASCPGCSSLSEVECGSSPVCSWCTRSGADRCFTVATAECGECSVNSKAACALASDCTWCRTTSPSSCQATCPACRDILEQGACVGALDCIWTGAGCTSPCPNNCTSHGDCVDEFCVCDPGWTGFACDLADLDNTIIVENTTDVAGSSSTALVVIIVLLAAVVAMCVAVGLFVVTRPKKPKFDLEPDATVRLDAMDQPVRKLVNKLLKQKGTQHIGTGEFAKIYRCRLDGEDIALKVMEPSASSNPSAQAEFQREVTFLSRLATEMSPHIVGVVFFLHDNPKCIAMECCTKGSLKDMLHKKTHPIPVKVKIAAQVARGMACIHSCGIVHLDLKTANILIDANNDAKIADFGISQDLSLPSDLDTIAYTIQYVAPERLKDPNGVDLRKADMYSFGMLAHATYTQTEPYEGENTTALAEKMKMNNVVRPAAGDDVHHHYRDVLERCLRLSPSERPPFYEVANDLLACGAECFGILEDCEPLPEHEKDYPSKRLSTQTQDGVASVASLPSVAEMSSMPSPAQG